MKKCSLRGLEIREDFRFISYPCTTWPLLSGYCLLTLDAPPLTEEDAHLGLFLIDGTWRYAETMLRSIPNTQQLVQRSLPNHFSTAYPRYQTGCPQPESGLASIEALYLAFLLTARCTKGLLDHYHWREEFLVKNALLAN
ncbi:MAG: DTW domain-containing protein [Anaplasmataceae bacterium]|nr:DTW domain-containing protein [Anaplasmataceae bacterium]